MSVSFDVNTCTLCVCVTIAITVVLSSLAMDTRYIDNMRSLYVDDFSSRRKTVW